MRSKIRIISLVLLFALLAVYLWPVPRVAFDEVYAKIDPVVIASLQDFRQAHPPKTIKVDGAR